MYEGDWERGMAGDRLPSYTEANDLIFFLSEEVSIKTSHSYYKHGCEQTILFLDLYKGLIFSFYLLV